MQVQTEEKESNTALDLEGLKFPKVKGGNVASMWQQKMNQQNQEKEEQNQALNDKRVHGGVKFMYCPLSPTRSMY